ncbi:hypothetical protein IX317_001314 [Fusobacterium sp. DD29]|uniref:hypothetical protein n=1 Tax=unclassified Fusobacterium TaxID=2648384 RepID=UPI001B8D1A4F|nr:MULTISPECIES: hypothetical protein [unclassified Fusobacterium]MBR8749640.1 hypothetical protein [Fusobacterium sp. DD29]MBR8761898.1 hypothetical protein [Fusobacterium sp. DD25]MBR8767919.1 hypothetical protein [Fusobacterium sp. DD43]MBR8771921.1 hypothetical protein [Fusobacterium sp. DD40]MBR8776195.1 hypothetical protein [Fusobacterium sp. DD17]
MNLILFFNGWGMDDGILKNPTIPEGFILKEVSYPYKVDIDISQYSDTLLDGLLDAGILLNILLITVSKQIKQ